MNDNDLIQKFFEGTLSKEELELFQTKLKDEEFNKKFKSQLKLISSIKLAENQLKEKKLYINPIRLAASLLIFLGIGTAIYLILRQPKLIPDHIVKKDTIKQEKTVDTILENTNIVKSDTKNLYADNYIPNATIEGLITSNNYRDIKKSSSIVLPSDSSSYKLNSSIPFMISIEQDIDILEIVIYNNQNSVVNKFILNNHEKKEIILNIPPGIYYWKINYNGNSKWGGKFYIKN